PIVVPCHWVIGSDRSLTGFGGGIEIKRFLLAHEQRVSGREGPQSSLPF
ncbi:MAG: MGMT family protein, partial [Planctomycetota bacterium]